MGLGESRFWDVDQDDVVADTSLHRKITLETRITKNRPPDDIGEDGQGDQDSFHDGPQGVLGLLDDFGHHGHD